MLETATADLTIRQLLIHVLRDVTSEMWDSPSCW